VASAFIAGGEDHIMPAAVNKSNAKHYDEKSNVDRVQGVPRPLSLHAWTGRLGGSRRLRSRLANEDATAEERVVSS
jgi:hypothetical protein